MSAALGHAALAITAAFFDSLWEGALIAGAAWLGLRCLPKLGAATRYAIWLCALAAIVLTPVLTVYLSERSLAPVADNAVTSARSDVFAAVQPRSEAAHVPAAAAQAPQTTPQTAPEPARVDREPAPPAPRKAQITVPQSLAAVVALVWILAACARGLLLVLNLRALAAIRRDAWLWSSAHEYPVFLSHRVQVPIAAGFARAAIILPASLVEQLRPDAVESIVVHEIAHLRRYDVWTNAFARIAEAFVALNPAAWFVLRRLAVEREIACDDWVVDRAGSGDTFARTLAAMASRGVCRAPIAAPSAFGSRHAIVVRIERLLDARPRHLRLSPPALGGALLLLALIALTMQTLSPVLAYTAPPAGPAHAPAVTIAANCAEPDHGIRWAPRRVPLGHLRHLPPSAFDLPDASAVAASAGAANTATFDFTVDASGRPRKVALVGTPRYPGVANDLAHLMMINHFAPATRNCVPVTSTMRTRCSSARRKRRRARSWPRRIPTAGAHGTQRRAKSRACSTPECRRFRTRCKTFRPGGITAPRCACTSIRPVRPRTRRSSRPAGKKRSTTRCSPLRGKRRIR